MGRELKRLFIDAETSPNIGYFWQAGYKLNISPESIIQERKIICVAYKWQGDREVQVVKWDKSHDDRRLLERLLPIIDSADEVVAHNGDRFDVPWFKTRCLIQGLPAPGDIKTFDTKSTAANRLYLNSNKLDYIGKVLGFGGKIDVNYQLWKDVMAGSDVALQKMIRYCKRDVVRLEQVYGRLEEYGAIKTHAGVLAGGLKSDCPKCASESVEKYGLRVTAAGTKKQRMRCRDCGRRFDVADSVLKRDEKIKGKIPEAKAA